MLSHFINSVNSQLQIIFNLFTNILLVLKQAFLSLEIKLHVQYYSTICLQTEAE
jgi:hypothetical protein